MDAATGTSEGMGIEQDLLPITQELDAMIQPEVDILRRHPQAYTPNPGKLSSAQSYINQAELADFLRELSDQDREMSLSIDFDRPHTHLSLKTTPRLLHSLYYSLEMFELDRVLIPYRILKHPIGTRKRDKVPLISHEDQTKLIEVMTRAFGSTDTDSQIASDASRFMAGHKFEKAQARNVFDQEGGKVLRSLADQRPNVISQRLMIPEEGKELLKLIESLPTVGEQGRQVWAGTAAEGRLWKGYNRLYANPHNPEGIYLVGEPSLKDDSLVKEFRTTHTLIPLVDKDGTVVAWATHEGRKTRAGFRCGIHTLDTMRKHQTLNTKFQ